MPPGLPVTLLLYHTVVIQDTEQQGERMGAGISLEGMNMTQLPFP